MWWAVKTAAFAAILVFPGTSAVEKSQEYCQALQQRCTDLNTAMDNSTSRQVLEVAFQTGLVNFDVDEVANDVCRAANATEFCRYEWAQTCSPYPETLPLYVVALRQLEICNSPFLGSYVTSLIACHKKINLTETIASIINELISSGAYDVYTPQGQFDMRCRMYEILAERIDVQTITDRCRADSFWADMDLPEILGYMESTFMCQNGSSYLNITVPTSIPPISTTTINWWNQTTTQRPWGQTTTDWRATTSNWNWWNQTTTRSWWQSTTTHNWWSPTTTPRPAVEIPAYLLNHFKVTCRRGSFNLSEEDPDLVDALTMVFDGDNTLNCRLILSDLHSWLLSRIGDTRQKRASDYEPIKVECARGNLTVSSVDPGTSEATDLVFRTGGSKNCITIYREFLNYIAYAFKSQPAF